MVKSKIKKKSIKKNSTKKVQRINSKKHWVILTLFVVAFAVVGVLLLRASQAAGRDPWVRPFAHDSIWNTPIGSNAKYVDAGFPYTGKSQLDKTYFLKLKSSDPLRDYVITGGWRDRCSGTVKTGIQLNLPNGFLIPDAHQNANGSWSTPNNGWEFLLPDGKTVISSGGGARCSGSGPIFGHGGKTTFNIYGDGINGGHGGSGLTRLGGAIRGTDMSSNEPIRHALDLVLYSKYFYSDNKQTKASTFRWPASKSDGYALNTSKTDRYVGTNPETRMGSLLALKPSLKPADLNITTKEGVKLFHAMQDWGGYITDDSAWDANTITVASDAVGTFTWDTRQKEEFGRIIDAASVVANNGPNSIGGGGTPRVKGHEPFGGQAPAPSPAPTPAPSPAPEPTPSQPPTDETTNYILPAGNFTRGKSITASSSISGVFTPDKAVDGDERTNESRWTSERKDNEWIQIDLGARKLIKQLAILWAGNTTKNYTVSVSSDNKSFAKVTTGSTDNQKFTGRDHKIDKEARYIRITGTSRWNSDYGNSIREIGVYADTILAAKIVENADTEQPTVEVSEGVKIKPKNNKSKLALDTSPLDANRAILRVSGGQEITADKNKKRVQIKLNRKVVKNLAPGETTEIDTTTLRNRTYDLTIVTTNEDDTETVEETQMVVDNKLNLLEKGRNFALQPLAGKVSGRTMNTIFGGILSVPVLPIGIKWLLLLRL